MVKFKNFPGVDKLLNIPKIKLLIEEFNKEIVTYSIRNVLNLFKDQIKENEDVPSLQFIVEHVISHTRRITTKSLQNVFNATGIVIHTNLGRAPFSTAIINEASEILKGYNNLEFDLEKAKRGSRYTHVSELLKYLSGAEDVLVVNNNAAAIMLILRAFAKNKEVIVSRGELIEIGGSFRLPDILAASDCKMIEIGTTNKTKIQDYEKQINENTAVFLKAHKSNYKIDGFTHEVSLKELVSLGKKHNIPVVYDMGSGLFNNNLVEFFKDEPDVQSTLSAGVNLVCFSGDKLLGGPQAGIIAGDKELIEKLKNNPLTRALRVGKLTLAFLESTCLQYLSKPELFSKNYIYRILNKEPSSIKHTATKLQKEISKFHKQTRVVESKGQFGGGSLPGKEINSYAVWLEKENVSNKQKSEFAEKMYYGLLKQQQPVLGILKKGNIYFDMLAIQDEDIKKIAGIIKDVYKNIYE
ncbi:MAG: L-seryl-tRNA(Sec) selenium transferase [Bacteroidales bacterium]|nr:L-seryl-tRNA(Sec) selenium transferase [Bacteroidales bacterium]